jgi:uncharacterized protein YndB with AHSA1/START domain
MSGTGVTTPSDREIVTTRLFDAPRELVFRAWTEPEHLVQWWGPSGFTNTFHEFDLRPGGVWRFVMHGPDGSDYENVVVFIEVLPPERLVYDHSGGDDDADRRFHVTVTFEDDRGKTRVTMRSLFATKEARDFVIREVGAIEGARQTLDRLADHLKTM